MRTHAATAGRLLGPLTPSNAEAEAIRRDLDAPFNSKGRELADYEWDPLNLQLLASNGRGEAMAPTHMNIDQGALFLSAPEFIMRARESLSPNPHPCNMNHST